MSLADSFPESLRKEFSDRNVELGSVIKLYDQEADKEKWHILVGFNSDSISTVSVRINSEKNLNVFNTEFLRYLCHHIKKEKNNFLDHDSYVDCSKLIEWKTEKITSFVTVDPGVVIGRMEEIELDTIRSIIAGARTIEPKQKKKYGLI